MEKLDEETVLFVLGDHGMTRTGDHGGDSIDEVAAALFVYSPAILHQETPDMVSDAKVGSLLPPYPVFGMGGVLLCCLYFIFQLSLRVLKIMLKILLIHSLMSTPSSFCKTSVKIVMIQNY